MPLEPIGYKATSLLATLCELQLVSRGARNGVRTQPFVLGYHPGKQGFVVGDSIAVVAVTGAKIIGVSATKLGVGVGDDWPMLQASWMTIRVIARTQNHLFLISFQFSFLRDYRKQGRNISIPSSGTGEKEFSILSRRIPKLYVNTISPYLAC